MKKATGKLVSSGTYVSNMGMRRLVFKKNIQMILGGIFSVFFIFAILQGIFGDNQVLRDGILTSAVMGAPFMLMFLAGLRNGRRAGLVRRYNLIFMCDKDGTVTLDELSRQIGKPAVKILSQLEWLFQNGVFCDCTLQMGGEPCVILSGKEGSKTSFINVVCEKCNGTTRLRAGTSGKCEYCGSAISARKIVS